MSRIFALVSVTTFLLIGAAALGAAVESSGSDSAVLDDMVGIFATGLEIGALVPIVLGAGILIAVLGVLAR